MNKKGRRITVGVLMDSAESYFNQRVITDILAAAEEKDIQIIFFFGGFLEKGKTSGTISYAYTLPESSIVDAIIIFPHSIAPYNPKTTSAILLEQYPDIPVYSLFCSISGQYSMSTEENGAIRDMVQHLIVDHGYRDIALVCGPDADESISRQRENVIRSILREQAISLDDTLIFRGEFTEETGKQAVQSILTGKHTYPEVLICLNDQIALGAVSEFRNHGITVPADIAVVGFDDIDETSLLPFSFTTINYPVWPMIVQMLERILLDAKGISHYQADSVFMPAEFMHRESCGCASFPEQIEEKTALHARNPRRASLSLLRKEALFRKNLEDIIEIALSSSDPAPFAAFINQAAIAISRTGDLAHGFLDTFSTQWTLSLLKHPDFDSQVFINSLFVDAFRHLLQSHRTAFARANTRRAGALSFYRAASDILSQKSGIQDTIRGIGHHLPELGIEEAHLVLLQPDNPNNGTIYLSYKYGIKPVLQEGNQKPTSVQDLLQFHKEQIQRPLAIIPVARSNIVYGYLALSLVDKEFEQFALIQDLVSRLIESAMTNTELQEHIDKLTQKNDILSHLSMVDEFSGLYNRRALYVSGRHRYEQSLLSKQSSAFIFLDMDGLKKINDQWGHKEGDIAIQGLSGILKKCFRGEDLVIRYGGDEFVIIMINVSRAIVTKSLARIETSLAQFNKTNKHPWKLAASWGIVYNTGEDASRSFEAVIEESDALLYEEKRKKKGL